MISGKALSKYPFDKSSTFMLNASTGVRMPLNLVYGAALYLRSGTAGSIQVTRMSTLYTGPADYQHIWYCSTPAGDELTVVFDTQSTDNGYGETKTPPGLLKDAKSTGLCYYGGELAGCVRCTENFYMFVRSLPHTVDLAEGSLVFDTSVVCFRAAIERPVVDTGDGIPIYGIVWNTDDFETIDGVVSVKTEILTGTVTKTPIRRIHINDVEIGYSDVVLNGKRRLCKDVVLTCAPNSSIRVATDSSNSVITVGRLVSE